MSDLLPGYDAWKTDVAECMTAEEEAQMERQSREQRSDFRDCLEGCIHDNRADLYLSELWDIARDVLLHGKRAPGEPEWQTDPKRWPTPNDAAGLLSALTKIVAAWESYNQQPRAIGYEVARDMADIARAAIERSGQ